MADIEQQDIVPSEGRTRFLDIGKGEIELEHAYTQVADHSVDDILEKFSLLKRFFD